MKTTKAQHQDPPPIIETAIEVLKIEAEGILGLADRIDHDFSEMVSCICRSKGRVIVAGIGKSGNVGRKIVATLNSTGTRALFLHPVEAIHGDLGMVGQDDILLALSNSGETQELNDMVPFIRDIGSTVIAFTGNKRSTLARISDIVINVGVKREACPMGLAPTASTTALMAMGDALAVVLMNQKQFKACDFKRFHPGGLLGQRLSKKVEDFMLIGPSIPSVDETCPMEDAVLEMNRGKLGVTLVLGPDSKLSGIITDGDIRRAVSKKMPLNRLPAKEIMTTNPKTLSPDTPAYDALNMMEQNQITVLPITTSDLKVRGILHLHDILGKGAFKFNGI